MRKITAALPSNEERRGGAPGRELLVVSDSTSQQHTWLGRRTKLNHSLPAAPNAPDLPSARLSLTLDGRPASRPAAGGVPVLPRRRFAGCNSSTLRSPASA